jgi:Contractile injection system tube protein
MRALKGAFLNFGAGLLGALPNIVVFQFNPDRVTRTPSAVRPPPRDDGSGTRDPRLQAGPPVETFSFTLRVDATDQLANSNPPAAASGILPALSALELLMVPKRAIDLFDLSGGNKPCQFPPHKLPIVLFFWGPLRIFPVNVTSLSITETEYDPLLNPVRAEVAVNLQVVTQGPAIVRGAYKYSQGVKEVMAALNLARGMAAVGGARF